MTTLTQQTPSLPEHCPHKLPTSCRLTARPICCACQDHRPQAATYRKYVDGVGYVMLGTRQDGYCWPCKEFWDVRTAAAGIQPQDARLPLIPDTTDFCNSWHDWHRGYRMILTNDGTETMQQLRGQPLNEVDIGQLPIPLDGSNPHHPQSIHWVQMPETHSSIQTRQQEIVAVSEEDRLFDSDGGEDEQTVSQEQQISSQSVSLPRTTQSTESQFNMSDRLISMAHNLERERDSFDVVLSTPHLTAGDARNLRTILRRMENLSASISNTTWRLQHFLNDHVSLDHELHGELLGLIRSCQETADLIVHRARNTIRHDSLRAIIATAERPRNAPVVIAAPVIPSPPTPAEQQRQAASESRMLRAFGTREDVQQPDYQSPINLMINRAQAYGERMETLRREEEAQQAETANAQRQLISYLADLYNANTSSTVPESNSSTTEGSIGSPDNTLTPGSGHGFAPEGRISGGLHVDSEGQVHHIYSDDTHGPEELSALFSSLRRLVLAQLRTRVPRAEGVSRLTYEHSLWITIARFSQETQVILSRTGQELGATSDLRNHLQYMLERSLPRVDGEALMDYFRRICGLPATAAAAPEIMRGDAIIRSSIPTAPQAVDMSRGSSGTSSDTGIRPSADWPRFNGRLSRRASETDEAYFERITTFLERHRAAASGGQPAALQETWASDRTFPSLPNFISPTQWQPRGNPFIGNSPMPIINVGPRGSRAIPTRAPPPTLENPARPLEATEMIVKLNCLICDEQVANIALVPCGHLVMCAWCSRKHAHTRLEGGERGSKCPLCRAVIKSRLEIRGLSGDGNSGASAGQKDGNDDDDNAGEGSSSSVAAVADGNPNTA